MIDGLFSSAIDWGVSAASNLGDSARLVSTAIQDTVNQVNPFSDDFLSGDAHYTAEEAERQNAARQGREYSQARADFSAHGGLSTIADAGDATVSDVKEAAGKVADAAVETVKKAAGVLDWLLTPTGILLSLGGVVAVVLLLPAVVEGFAKGKASK